MREQMQGKRILITGASGYVATNLVAALRDVDCSVMRVTRHTRIPAVAGKARIVDLCADVRSPDVWDAWLDDVDIVFHLAAQISVPDSMEHPLKTVRANTEGTMNMLIAAHRQGVKNVVLSSSAAIYGDNPEMPKRESMIPEPKSPYAVSKLDGEYYLRIFGK